VPLRLVGSEMCIRDSIKNVRIFNQNTDVFLCFLAAKNLLKKGFNL
jgi:hypothetical protein